MSMRKIGQTLLSKIEKLPAERLKYSISFKESQYERFRLLTGAPKKYVIQPKQPTVKEIIFNKLSSKKNGDDIKKQVFTENLTEDGLKQMVHSLDNLTSNKFKNYYDVGEKMTKPAGYPYYYERLLREIKGENKETFFSTVRTVVFGK